MIVAEATFGTRTDLKDGGSTDRTEGASRSAAWPPLVPRQADGSTRAAERAVDGDGTSDHLERRLSEVLRNFAYTMGTDFPIQAILDHLVGQIVAMLPVTAAGVTLIAPDAEPRYIAASDDAALRYERVQTELGEGPCLLAYRSGNSVGVPDLRIDDRFPRFSPRALQAGLRAVFTFPLRHEQQPLGALDIYRDSPGPLSAAAKDAAQTLADVAAAYLLNAQARLDLQQAGDRARQQSLHDALTGLPNRTLILDRLQHACLRNRRSKKICAVLFIDLDGLKSVNDAHGHAVGDELLVVAARRLTGLIRPGDTLGRLAGDEFVVVCEDLHDLKDATSIGSRLLAALARPFLLSAAEIAITASVGIAQTGGPGSNQTPEQLVGDADSAMYQAKRRGGNQQQVFDPHLEDVPGRQDELERDLRGAADRGELHTAYQPIVHTTDGYISGFEALLRWTHPTRGPISPATVIPLAEESGLIQPIGAWVPQQACTDLHRWQRADGGDKLGIAVNISAHQLMSTGFLDIVSDIIDTCRTEPGRLTLEVTESVFLTDAQKALTVLRGLRGLGIALALDDFGTVYAALNCLQSFPVNILKIDRSFVADLGRAPAAGIIVAAIVQLAHGLDMSVIAEGVETAVQLEAVQNLGCTYSQGFYFAKPMPAQAITELIRHGQARLPHRAAQRTRAAADLAS